MEMLKSLVPQLQPNFNELREHYDIADAAELLYNFLDQHRKELRNLPPNATLQERIGDREDVFARVHFQGDLSVGLADTFYDIAIPNGFKAASDDEEASQWVEDARKAITDVYFSLEQDRKVTVTFDWELRSEAEWEKKIDDLSE